MLKDKALKIYLEKRAFVPSLVPEVYYGTMNAPEDASILDRAKHLGKAYLGGLGGHAKGLMLGGALGGAYGVFNPFRSKSLSPSSKSVSILLDALIHGAAGAGIGGAIGRVRGARAATLPIQEQPDNVYDIRAQ